jgi:hypothetical protein
LHLSLLMTFFLFDDGSGRAAYPAIGDRRPTAAMREAMLIFAPAAVSAASPPTPSCPSTAWATTTARTFRVQRAGGNRRIEHRVAGADAIWCSAVLAACCMA